MALKGKQKNIDMNKNNRIDAEDFALLKKKKEGKVMKARMGKSTTDEFIKRRKKLAGIKDLATAIKTAPGSIASQAEVKQGTKRLGKFVPKKFKAIGALLGAAGAGAVGQKLIDKMKKKKKKKADKKMGGGLAAATERLRAQGKMGGGMMKKYSNGGDVYGKMADKKFEKYATSKEAQLHAKDFDAGLNRAERRAASETMLAYKKKQKLGKQAAVKKMGGGMMNKPMGYKSGKSVMAKGCKLGRKKPTKMYT